MFWLHTGAELHSYRYSIHKQLTCNDFHILSVKVVQYFRLSQWCCCLPGHRKV